MPIPDEKARAWTRPEDYWPPRRLRRTGRSAPVRFQQIVQEQGREQSRPLLDVVPFAALLVGLAVLAIAIMALAWPVREAAQPTPKREPIEVEIGTARKGWIDDAEPARR
jgi:hypothetical protein